MNEEKYKLLELIDTSDYGADNWNLIEYTDKERRFQELFDDNLIEEIEQPHQTTRYVLTPHGRERLEDYKKSAYLQKSIKEIHNFLNKEKQDRIKSDKKQSKSTWIGNSLMFLTLIVALITLFK